MSDTWYTAATYTPKVDDYYWCRFIVNDKPVVGVCTYAGGHNWETKLLDDEKEPTWTMFHVPEMEFQIFETGK